MESGLPSEFSSFCSLTKKLRAILQETRRCFKEINGIGRYEEGTQLSSSEEADIEQLAHKVPCMIVFGQNAYAKAIVVNELFGKALLPIVTDSKPSTWRMVRFLYGRVQSVSLTLPGSFVLVDNLVANQRPWTTLPEEDLKVQEYSTGDTSLESSQEAVMEVKISHPLLKEGGQVVMSAGNVGSLELTYNRCTDDTIPVLIYAITHNSLTPQELDELEALKEVVPSISIFFVRVPPPVALSDPDDSLHDAQLTRPPSGTPRINPVDRRSRMLSITNAQSSLNLFQQLTKAGYLSLLPTTRSTPSVSGTASYEGTTDSELCENFETFGRSAFIFARQCLQYHLVRMTSLLHVVHTRCLQMFIMTAFDMARDMQITPKRLDFACEKEKELYSSLMDIADRKQGEIRLIIKTTVEDLRPVLLEKAAAYEFIGVEIAENGEITTARDLKICIGQIQNLVIQALNTAIAGKLLGSVDILRDSYTGVLSRCLEKIEESDRTDQIAYRTSQAFKDILNSAYQVEITVKAGSSLMHLLLEKMKQLMRGLPWSTHPQIGPEWKTKIAEEMLSSLSEYRLAHSICAQIKDRVCKSHRSFSTALRQLQTHHNGRLEKTEEHQLKLRKIYAPKVARLALESTSFKDYILHGAPTLGREIGRGQYGVVFSCEKWGSYKNCAIKSVVPPDERHWNDLALEFYYTKNIPEHPRIVSLRGSVIDYTYGGGAGDQPAVLLIMDRLQRDLYAAIKNKASWPTRLQVAMDVIVGLRYLHNQALVHRDIKLKNVLLDKHDRGLITDLGFCKPEAMMSGSIVGTPIHMAPELFNGNYDHTVDVYAFGILFWYVCAGHVKLPHTYEQCMTKDMLWSSVRQGKRPEKLVQFDHDCWTLMQSCWHGDPPKRPLLGVVECKLTEIIEKCAIEEQHLRGAKTLSPRNLKT